MRIVNVYEARGPFSKLSRRGRGWGGNFIARSGRPIVKLVAVNPPRRVSGRYSDGVPAISDDAWSESDDAVAALFAKASG